MRFSIVCFGADVVRKGLEKMGLVMLCGRWAWGWFALTLRGKKGDIDNHYG